MDRLVQYGHEIMTQEEYNKTAVQALLGMSSTMEDNQNDNAMNDQAMELESYQVWADMLSY